MRSFFNLFMPHQSCLLCDQPAEHSVPLCHGCLHDLPYSRRACTQCGVEIETVDQTCGECLQHPPPIDRCFSLCEYREPSDRLLQHLKFHGQLAYANLFGKLLADRYSNQIDKPQALVPVPLHRQRLRSRGYNQSVEIAKPIARALKIPLLTHECVRTLATQPQSDLPQEERHRNIRGAFAIAGTIPFRHVAIIDDVMTTGSTVYELAKTLKNVGVERVDAWVCARASK